MTISVLTVIGTRPEAIKMAPVLAAFSKDDRFKSRLCLTGQHRDMVRPILDLFGLTPDHDLDVMDPSVGLAGLAGRILSRLAPVISQEPPDWLLVHGDTISTASAALAGFYQDLQVAHVEAGLRTHDLRSPWPEELNRRVTSLVCRRHFAPTDAARANLIAEDIPADQIDVTGNTVVDAVIAMRSRLAIDPHLNAEVRANLPQLDSRKRLILVTGHRRENFNAGLGEMCAAIRQLAARGDVEVLWPVHPNPRVQGLVQKALADTADIHLVPPIGYAEFVLLMSEAHMVITDSGGIQEEAPSLGLPVLVTRDTTERPEVIDVGAGELVGAAAAYIVRAASRLLDDPSHHASMARAANPYGDGQAARRILDGLAGDG